MLLGMRQEETHRSLAMRNRARVQLREAAAVLPQELRGLSPADGDIEPGNARDSTLEFRATLAAGALCRATADVAELPRGSDSEWTMVAWLATPEPGDSLWIYEPAADGGDRFTADSVIASRPGRWRGRLVGGISRTSGSCGIFEPESATGSRFVLQLRKDSSGAVPGPGSPFRVTRRARYSIYRSSADGGWYLGARDWNNALERFDAVQPIAGPFTAPRAAEGRRSRFQYFDAAGDELPSGTPETSRIARLTLSLCAEEKLRRSGDPKAYRTPCEGDEVDVTIAFRDGTEPIR